MRRVVRPLLFALVPFGAVADAQQAPPPVAAAPPPPDVIALPFQEIDARMTVPVTVGARGPYRFIIDTGAERSVVSRELATDLKLLPGRPVTVISMTDRQLLDTVIVPDLITIPPIGSRADPIEAPAVEQRFLGAPGLLGLDSLREHAVSIDFEAGSMAVEKSARRPSAPAGRDEIVVRGKNRFGQLIVTDAHYGELKISVVLDTGSQVTMGNAALRRRVVARRKEIRPIVLTSVTGGTTVADYAVVSNVRVGGASFVNLPVAFAEVAPFERFGLKDKPALMLGMDALRIFRQVQIDFPNRQVRLKLPRDSKPMWF